VSFLSLFFVPLAAFFMRTGIYCVIVNDIGQEPMCLANRFPNAMMVKTGGNPQAVGMTDASQT
jgi:hypothetical protein